jgi:hypothetical protein
VSRQVFVLFALWPIRALRGHIVLGGVHGRGMGLSLMTWAPEIGSKSE